MAIAASLIYWVIVAIWLSVLGTVCWFHAANPRIFGTARLLLGVVAIDTARNLVENIYFGLYVDSRFGLFSPDLSGLLGQPLLLIMPKALNVISGLLVLAILLLRWLPEALGEHRSAEAHSTLLNHMGTTDGMTGLFNRGHFLIQAEIEFERSRRYDHPLSVLLLDIDHFQAVNDRYGHDVGDRVIVEVAAILRYMAREADLAARLGGEEFVVMLPETDVADAASLGERLRAAIADTRIQATGGRLSLTVSIGVGGSDGNSTVGEMLKQADLALCRAKQDGRNRIRLFGESVDPPAYTGVSGR